MSATSIPAFFNRGVTITCFCDAGSRPCDNDALTIAVINGSNSSRTSFRRKVGTGSSGDDFEDDAVITRRTSASVTGSKTVIEVAADDDKMSGGQTPSVAARIPLTFSLK